MEYQAVLEAVRSLPVEDQMRLVSEVQEDWQESDPDLTPELIQELDRRIAAHKANPQSAIPWEVVLAQARARHKK
jgi:putative addiction module component (TIGR02574 family)